MANERCCYLIKFTLGLNLNIKNTTITMKKIQNAIVETLSQQFILLYDSQKYSILLQHFNSENKKIKSNTNNDTKIDIHLYFTNIIIYYNI